MEHSVHSFYLRLIFLLFNSYLLADGDNCSYLNLLDSELKSPQLPFSLWVVITDWWLWAGEITQYRCLKYGSWERLWVYCFVQVIPLQIIYITENCILPRRLQLGASHGHTCVRSVRHASEADSISSDANATPPQTTRWLLDGASPCECGIFIICRPDDQSLSPGMGKTSVSTTRPNGLSSPPIPSSRF